MRRFWWTVWIEVAIVAFLLYMGYDFARDKVQEYLTPYLIEEEEDEFGFGESYEDESYEDESYDEYDN